MDPIPRVLHPPVPGTRSPLVPIPAPNAPCGGQGRLDPQLIRVLRSIFGYQNNPPAPPGFQAMLSLAVQPRADYTAERPRLPAGMLLSVILVIVSRNHRRAAPRDPWRLRRGVPGGGSPTGTPHQTHRLQDGEPRGVFCNTTALGSKKHSFFAFSAPWHAQCPQLSSVMGRWEAGPERGFPWVPHGFGQAMGCGGSRPWVFGVGEVWVQHYPAPRLHAALAGPSGSDNAWEAEMGMEEGNIPGELLDGRTMGCG